MTRPFDAGETHQMKTEKQLRDSKAPSPNTAEELTAYIEKLVGQKHDYGTCVYAMSLSAVAAFNYVSRKLGVTGFQASCADLDILKRTRRLDCPFMIVKADDALYPQYDLRGKLDEALNEWRPWLKERALKKLEDSATAHPDILRHWSNLAYNGDNPAARAEIEAKAQFLSNEFTEDFIKKNQAGFKRFGIREVYLRRDNGDVSKAESCKEGCTFRINLPVSLSFTRKIGIVKVDWSVDTELPNSNGLGKLRIDFSKLGNLLAVAKNPKVKKAIKSYVAKALTASKGAESTPEPQPTDTRRKP